MTSQFYKDRFDRLFPVTMLFLEQVSAAVSELHKESEVALRDILVDAISKTGAVKGAPTQDHLLYALQRLTVMQGQREDTAKAKDSDTGQKRTFGSDYLKWIAELDHQGLCLHAADYDVERARHLYCHVDYELVVDLARQKADKDWHDKIILFEACLFGFGGGYGKSSSANETVYDLKKDRKAAEAAIKAIGF